MLIGKYLAACLKPGANFMPGCVKSQWSNPKPHAIALNPTCRQTRQLPTLYSLRHLPLRTCVRSCASLPIKYVDLNQMQYDNSTVDIAGYLPVITLTLYLEYLDPPCR